MPKRSPPFRRRLPSAGSPQEARMHDTAIDVPLGAIFLDWDAYPREAVHEDRVLDFRELLRDPEAAPLPPVEVVLHATEPGRLVLADGFHRYHAHLDEGH